MSDNRQGKEGDRSSGASEVLADWTFTPQQWKQFYQWENRRLRIGTVLEVVAIAMLSTTFLQWRQATGWLLSIGLSIAAALLYGLVKYQLTMATVAYQGRRSPRITITNDKVVVNGKTSSINDEKYRCGRVRMRPGAPVPVLEIIYHWNTRKGPKFGKLRVPVPEDMIFEAEEVAKILSRDC